MLTPVVDIPASLARLRDQYRVDMIKLDEDLDRYRCVIEADRPEVVVECGTWEGGSARWFAEAGLDVITIDTVRYPKARGGSKITWLTGSTADPGIASQVGELVAGRRTMVVLDSDHSAAHVAAEIRLYAPLVSPGCHLVIEDGILTWMDNKWFQGSPLEAVEELLVPDPAFERDEATEAMFPVSMYPCGWWTRRKAHV